MSNENETIANLNAGILNLNKIISDWAFTYEQVVKINHKQAKEIDRLNDIIEDLTGKYTHKQNEF